MRNDSTRDANMTQKEIAALILKSKAKGKTCPLCGSPRVNVNQANTIFCLNCDYCVTRKKNISRMPGHPMFKELGYKIKAGHFDIDVLFKLKMIPSRKQS